MSSISLWFMYKEKKFTSSDFYCDKLLLSELKLPSTSVNELDCKFDIGIYKGKDFYETILVIGDADGYLNIYSLSKMSLIKRELIEEASCIKTVSISKDGSMIGCTSEKGLFAIYELSL